MSFMDIDINIFKTANYNNIDVPLYTENRMSMYPYTNKLK